MRTLKSTSGEGFSVLPGGRARSFQRSLMALS